MLDHNLKGVTDMNYSHEVERMCPIAKGPHHGPAPIPGRRKMGKGISDLCISGLSHGIAGRTQRAAAN